MSTEVLPRDAALTGPSTRRSVRWTAGMTRWAVGLGLLIVWQLLASPGQVAATAGALLDDGTLPRAAGVTLLRLAGGFAVGALGGLVLAGLAILARHRPRDGRPASPLGVLPYLALLPLLAAWWGPGETTALALVALGAAVPAYLHARDGLGRRHPGLHDVATGLHLTRRQRFRHVTWPGAVPEVLTGLRLGLASAWLSVVVAEQLLVEGGLGSLAGATAGTDVIVVGVLGYAALALLTHGLLAAVERRVLAWR